MSRMCTRRWFGSSNKTVVLPISPVFQDIPPQNSSVGFQPMNGDTDSSVVFGRMAEAGDWSRDSWFPPQLLAACDFLSLPESWLPTKLGAMAAHNLNLCHMPPYLIQVRLISMNAWHSYSQSLFDPILNYQPYLDCCLRQASRWAM